MKISVLYPETDRCEMQIPPNGILIGRSPACNIRLTDEFASAKHCKIFYKNETLIIEDLGSTNGTTLDGTEIGISNPTPINPGQNIQIGISVLKMTQ